MPTDYRRAHHYLARLLRDHGAAQLAARLEPRAGAYPAKIPRRRLDDAQAIVARWEILSAAPSARPALLDPATLADAARYQRNIENFIGTVKLPVGLAGPLRVNGLFAHGDYYVPLATTEAALVASYSRGAQLLTEVGGASVLLLNEGLGRAPGFMFRTAADAGQFAAWAVTALPEFEKVAGTTTRHGRISDLGLTIEGNHVYLLFEFDTGDAAGQNMVTIATQAICEYIDAHAPIKPRSWFVEANMSGDKKASAQSFLSVRGKKVTAEVRIPAELVKSRLHATPSQIAEYWRMSALGGVMSGTMGVQGHYANGLAALYIACGQDAACVAESAVGVTRFEVEEDGTLYVAVTLPNLVVGTRGGGTELPSQHACLEILGLAGDGQARAFAEVAAALALAGELSISGALTAGEFTRAHEALARRKGSA